MRNRDLEIAPTVGLLLQSQSSNQALPFISFLVLLDVYLPVDRNMYKYECR